MSSLDLVLTPELVNEGHARQLQRFVQDARRASGLAVTDRIELVLDADDEVQAWLAPHLEHLASQVLATSCTYGSVDDSGFDGELDGHVVRFAITTAG